MWRLYKEVTFFSPHNNSYLIYLFIDCPESVRLMPQLSECHWDSDQGLQRIILKLVVLPSETTAGLAVRSAAGRMFVLGGDGHHIVRTEDFNPVTVRVLDEGQAFHFTWEGREEEERMGRN